jgi:Cullin family
VFVAVKAKATQAIIDIINKSDVVVRLCTLAFTFPMPSSLFHCRERDGVPADRALLRKCIEIYEAMGEGNLETYQLAFEQQLLGATGDYYASKSREWIESDSTPLYLQKVTASSCAGRAFLVSHL